MDWPFPDPPNTACFTTKAITQRGEWVYYVTHDASDGAWQFHAQSGPTTEEDASLVGLGTLFGLDPSIGALADLPLGWHAWRDAADAPWQRAPKQ